MTDGRGPVVGDIVGGRYRLDAEIGVGGMAVVYRATDLKLDRVVAVKVFRSEVAAAVDPQRTTREGRLLAGMQHPAVVSALDASSGDGDVTYLVMELVEGDDLKTLLKRGPLDPDLARRVLIDVTGALALLHGRGVVHRDVKPANILVVRDTERHRTGITAKLTDFGIAQAVDGARITATDTILGTAAYLSPEQVRGEPVGPATDVYSAGLVLLECLTGRRAFPGPPPEAAVARLSTAPPIPPDASPELRELLTAMTAEDPGDRPMAGVVGERLRDLAGAMTVPDEEATAPVPRPVPALLPAASLLPAAAIAADGEPVGSRPRRGLVSGLAAAAVLAVGATGVLLAAPLLFGGGIPGAARGAVVPPGDAVSAPAPAATSASPDPTASHFTTSPSPSRTASASAVPPADDSGSSGSSSRAAPPASDPPVSSSPPRRSTPPSSAPPHTSAPPSSAPPSSAPPSSAPPSSPPPSSAPPSSAPPSSPPPSSAPPSSAPPSEAPPPTDTPSSSDSATPSDPAGTRPPSR